MKPRILSCLLAWSASAVTLAQAAPARELPEADVSVQLRGISAAFPPSSITGLNMALPSGSLFYSATSVTGAVVITLPGEAGALPADWSAAFRVPNVLRYPPSPAATNPPALVDDVELAWAARAADAPTNTAVFTLSRKHGQEFAPGLYLFTWSFAKSAPFQVNVPDRNAYFVISRSESIEDQLNQHEAAGDVALRRPLSPRLGSAELRRQHETKLTAARSAYEQFLALRPDDDAVLLKLAETCERQGEYTRAASLFRDTVRVWDQQQGLKRAHGWGPECPRGTPWQAIRKAVAEHAERLEKHVTEQKRKGP